MTLYYYKKLIQLKQLKQNGNKNGFIYLFTFYLPLTVYKNSRLKSTIKLYSSTNN